MKTYLDFINENIIQSKEFVNNLEKFIDKNDKKALLFLAKHQKDIPPMFKKAEAAYRGMIFTPDEVNNIKNKGIVLKDFSSWTTTYKIAEGYVIDKRYKSTVKKGKNLIGIIFKKKLSNIIVNVTPLVLYLNGAGYLDDYDFDEIAQDSSAFNENEIIADKNLKLSNKDIFKEIDLNK